MDLIEFIYENLIVFLRCNSFRPVDVGFLKSLQRELDQNTTFDLFSNKYITFVTTENLRVHIPSRLYKFDQNTPDSRSIRFPPQSAVDQIAPDEIAECSVSAPSSVLPDVFKILQRISKALRVFISYFAVYEFNSAVIPKEEASLIISTLKMNENTQAVGIFGHFLSPEAFKHIAQQLCQCSNLQALSLTDIPQNIPKKIGQAISLMTSLKVFNMANAQLPFLSTREIMSGLSRCGSLVNLNLKCCVLTDCLQQMLSGVNHRSLEVLDLGYTKLCLKDIKAIADAAKLGTIDQLRHLILEGNSLTECMGILFPLETDDHPGLEYLEFLGLNSTKLSKTDVDLLFQSIQLNKLPALKHLDIGSNCLTGCIQRLRNVRSPRSLFLEGLNVSYGRLSRDDLRTLPIVMKNLPRLRSLYLIGNGLTGILGELFTEHGLPSVGLLDLQETKLDRRDINSLSGAVREGKVPHIRKLFLYANNLSGVEAEFKNFLKTCATHFKTSRIDIRISLKDLPNADQLKKEIISICQGTSVWVNWTEVESTGNTTKVRLGGFLPFPGVMEWLEVLHPSLETRIKPSLDPHLT